MRFEPWFTSLGTSSTRRKTSLTRFARAPRGFPARERSFETGERIRGARRRVKNPHSPSAKPRPRGFETGRSRFDAREPFSPSRTSLRGTGRTLSTARMKRKSTGASDAKATRRCENTCACRLTSSPRRHRAASPGCYGNGRTCHRNPPASRRHAPGARSSPSRGGVLPSRSTP